MTANQIYGAVAALGMESELENSKTFYTALNRAILRTNALSPMLSDIEIHNIPLALSFVSTKNIKVGKYAENYEIKGANATSFCFEACGNGIATVSDGISELERVVISEKQPRRYKRVVYNYNGIETADIVITFSGDYMMYVGNAAIYTEKLSNNADDVPDSSEYVKYDMKSLAEDFLCFSDNPLSDCRGRPVIGGYYTEQGKNLFLQRELNGFFRVGYEKCPVLRTVDNSDDELELDCDLQELVVLLCGYYCWLDDDPDKAASFLADYREQAENVRSKRQNPGNTTVANIYRW